MKRFAIFLICFGLLLISVKPVDAALLVVNNKGKIVWKVLGLNTFEVKNIFQTPTPPADSQISLSRMNGKVELNVISDSGTTQTDVTSYYDDLVEIETRGDVKTYKIANLGDRFTISQEGVVANTYYPITINAKTNEVTIRTSKGEQLITVLPFDVVEDLQKANVIDQTTDVELAENLEQELQYIVSGEKKLRLLNFIDFPVSIKAHVSAVDGTFTETEAPIWYKILGFLFT